MPVRARAHVGALLLVPLVLFQPRSSDLQAHRSAPARAASVTAAAVGASGDPACGETAYKKNGGHWASTYRWFFAAGTTPEGMKRLSAENSLRRAVVNITGSQNPCGLTDQVNATGAYQGRTSAKPNITSSSGCGKPDGKSVIGFGELAPSDLGLTCYWTKNGNTVEADIKLNKTNFNWYVKKPSPCVGKFNVEAVATHELGHAFGLDHPGDLTQAHLTMYPVIAPCQASQRSLGKGDVRGLRALY